MQDGSRVEFANTLRGLAAVAVVISHFFGTFWMYRPGVAALTNAPALPLETHAVPIYVSWLHVLPIFNWGGYGVALFFVISGFVIPFSLRKTNWAGFVVSRIFRIFPTYLVGFSITLLAIAISGAYFSKDWPFSLREILIHYIPGIRDILWSRPIDGIVWTLEIEMKFYLLCACLVPWFRRRSLKVFLAPIALFLISLVINPMIPDWNATNAPAWRLATIYTMCSSYIIYMFVGVMFHYLHQGAIKADRAYLGIGALFALYCVHYWAGPNSASIGVVWSPAFAVLTFAFAYSFPNVFKSRPLSDFLARISYPLYAIHGIAGYVAIRIMLDRGFKAWVSLVVVTAACLLVSWLIHILVEGPFQRRGKRLASRLWRDPAHSPERHGSRSL